MVEKLTKYVSELLSSETTGHGMEHINRVLKLSLKFAEQENADLQIVSLIALLHDVDDYKLFGNDNAEKLVNARMIMDYCEVNKDIQEYVCEAIRSIGYGKRLKGKVPSTLEGMIVSDADMCDALGANGILRVFTYQMKNNKPFFDREILPTEDLTSENYKLCADSGVNHMFEKVLKLKNLMLTAAGREEAKKRHNLVVDFLYHLFEEEDVPEWTKYLDDFLDNQLEGEKYERKI